MYTFKAKQTLNAIKLIVLVRMKSLFTNLFVVADSLGVGAFAEADHADGRELDDVFGEGNEFENRSEFVSLEGTVQRGHDHRLSFVCHLE